MYKGSDGNWFCSTTVERLGGAFYTFSLSNIGKEWKYGKDGSWVNNDATIRFSSISSPTSACLLCKTVRLTSTGQTNSTLPDYLGLFTAVPEVFSAGRPVYRNENGKVLKIIPEYTDFNVHDEADIARVQSGSGPTCVTQDKANYSARFDRGWQVKDGDEWKDDDTMEVTCED